MTTFAASLPIPAHNLPGGRLATGIRDAMTLSSFRSHMGGGVLPGKSSDESQPAAPVWPAHPLEPILSCHLEIRRPAVADSRPCVCFRELAGLLAPGELAVSAAMVLFPLASVPVSRTWRKTRDSGSTFTLAAEPWVTLREAEAIIKVAPGMEAQRLRLEMRRAGWRPLKM